ncbi:MAG: ribonucleotide reductase N-terminal alpha domain-containing protein, partial [Hyphomicrobium sp.]
MRERDAFLAPVSQEIWERKYRFKAALDGASSGTRPSDNDLEATFRRVAEAAASVERDGSVQATWGQRFFDAISDFGFLPAGRILAGAGTGREVTLFNCFVMGRIEDDLS